MPKMGGENNKYDMATQKDLRQFVEREVYICQSSLVDDLLKKEIFSYENVENLYQGDEVQEIYEWWVVSDWLAKKLNELKEPILENNYGVWWGRTTTGQAIHLDAVIASIYEELQ